MSPRAAWRLEQLGFSDVYDYRGGKADWMAAGLGRDGKAVATLTAGDVARVDVPTCSSRDRLGDVRARVAQGVCVVTNAQAIALGVLEIDRFEDHGDETPVGDIMEVLPHARRPSAELETLVAQLDDTSSEYVLITTPEGRLIGVLQRSDGQQALERSTHEDASDTST